MFSMCARLAISGTTPRNRACRSTWLATMLERTCTPSTTMAAPVSSHVDSMARIVDMSVDHGSVVVVVAGAVVFFIDGAGAGALGSKLSDDSPAFGFGALGSA